MRRAKAKITADQIAQAINAGSGRLFFGDDEREFSKAAVKDEFVLSYVYGAILFSIELVGETEAETVGYLALEVFERLFPGYGKNALQACNAKIEDGNESFNSAMKLGFREMKGIWDSPGTGLLSSLHDHLTKIQSRL